LQFPHIAPVDRNREVRKRGNFLLKVVIVFLDLLRLQQMHLIGIFQLLQLFHVFFVALPVDISRIFGPCELALIMLAVDIRIHA